MRIIAAFILLCLFCACSPSPKGEQKQKSQLNAPVLEDSGLMNFFSWAEDRIPLVSAHRGGPYIGYPENAIETFAHVASKGPVVIECDIAMTSDSVLVMMHDNTLERTTTGTGNVIDFTWEELQHIRLKDHEGNLTDFEIPTLTDVLIWGKGKALFTLDVKRGVPFRMVVDAVVENQMEDYAAIISYNANDAELIHRLDNRLMISVGIGSQLAYEAHAHMGIPDQNMIAFVGVSEPEPSVYEMLHEKGISTILGALGNLDKKAEAKGDSLYAGLVKRGADVLATDRPLEALKAIQHLWPTESSKYKFIQID